MSSNQTKAICVVGYLILLAFLQEPFIRYVYWELSGGLLNAFVIGLFFVSYYYLFYWRDSQTAFEVAVVAWVVTGINVALIILNFYQSIALSRPLHVELPPHPLWVLAIVQFIATQAAFLTAAFLSVPFVWFYLRRRRKIRLRLKPWILLAIALVFLDVFIHVVVFVPLWLFFLVRTG